MSESVEETLSINRRKFLKTSAVVSAAVALGQNKLFAAGSDTIRIGLVGCGSRGTAAAKNCVAASENIQLVALADMFEDKIQASFKDLKTNGKRHWSLTKPWESADKVKVTEDTMFTGFDAYKKLLACDLDVVILATPPGFRHIHIPAAVEAGKHIFLEKPAGVDPAGIRKVIEAAKKAEEKGLAIVAGTQRHYQAHYLECVKRVKNGDIGRIVAAQCWWNWDRSKWHFTTRKEGWSDMEYQIRAWPYFTWLSGDHIVEQHLHNLDVINWVLETTPENATGTGGRLQRTGPDFGNIYDHFAVNYEYPNNIKVSSMCRQQEGTDAKVGECFIGTKGIAYMTERDARIEGENPVELNSLGDNPYEEEHRQMIASIREGKPINEGVQVAHSTLTAIIGRMSAYLGKGNLSWGWVLNRSKLDLSPEKYEMGDLSVRPVAVPGQTHMV